MMIHSFNLLWLMTLGFLPHVSEGSQVLQDHFVRVGRVPRATTETTVQRSSLSLVQCASRCVAMQETCGGFHIVNQAYNCVLLEGLNGVSDPSDANIQAFISIYSNGVRHFFIQTSVSWDQAVLLCQSMGMVMVSYPTDLEVRNWMNSFNNGLLLIGAKKDPANPSQVYDINTNELLTVDWNSQGARHNLHNTIGLVVDTNTFYAFNDWWVWNTVGVLCSQTV